MLKNIFKRNCRNANDIYKVIPKDKVREFLERGDIYIIDVRNKSEYGNMHIKNSINIPVNEIYKVKDLIKDKEAIIAVYCLSGARAKMAINSLSKMGYNNLYIFGTGGLNSLNETDLLVKS